MDILNRLYSRLLMEFAGTSLLAYTVFRASKSDLKGIEQAFLIGLCVTLLVHILGRYSGAHLNPAVSIVFWIQAKGRKNNTLVRSLSETVAYAASQVAGAMVGKSLAQNGDELHPIQRLDGFGEEIILTMIILLLVITWSREGRLCPVSQPLSGIVIGSGVTFLAALGGITSSGIFNPAISISLLFDGTRLGVHSMLAAQLIAVMLVSLSILTYQNIQRH
jgi:glycerol uptake facilitator-like aquaporin